MLAPSQQAGPKEIFFAGAAQPVVHPAVKYSIKLHRDGKLTTVPASHRFQDGDKFQFLFELNTAAHIYVLNCTLEGNPESLLRYNGTKGIVLVQAEKNTRIRKETFQLVFPSSLAADSLFGKGSRAVPDAGRYFQFDKQPGIEKLVVLISPKPLNVNEYFHLSGGRAGRELQSISGEDVLKRLQVQFRDLEANTVSAEAETSREICFAGCDHYSAPRDPAKPFLINVDLRHYSAKVEGQATRGIELVGPPQVKRKALLIGNQNYAGQPLVNPIHDAADLGEQLKKSGFEVRIELDTTKTGIITSVEAFAKTLAAGDFALFYFSGHGLQMEGENYLVPVEFNAVNMSQAKSAAVPFGRLKTALERSQAAISIMILDSCRNNPFLTNAEGKAQGLALLEAGLGSYIAFAASPGQTASDNPAERNGLFTKYLLQAMGEPLHVAELFRKVRQSVYDASGRKQRPYVHDQVIADYFISEPPKRQSPAVRESLREVEEAKRRFHDSKCGESVGILEKATRLDPENPHTHNALGLAYRCAGLHQEALRSFSIAIDASPGYAPAYLNRGELFLENAKYELALRDFDWAIEQDPNDAAPVAKRGMALLAMRRYEDARDYFTRALELDPAHTGVHHGRALVFHQLGLFRQALSDLNSAIALRPNAAAYWRDRARVRERMGDRAGASGDRAAADQLSPR